MAKRPIKGLLFDFFNATGAYNCKMKTGLAVTVFGIVVIRIPICFVLVIKRIQQIVVRSTHTITLYFMIYVECHLVLLFVYHVPIVGSYGKTIKQIKRFRRNRRN